MPITTPDLTHALATPDADPCMPRMIAVDGDVAPAAPAVLRDTGVDPHVLVNLALKAGFTVPSFTTDWASRRLHLPQVLVGDILDSLREEKLLEVLGDAGPFGYRYSVSQRGRERAARLLEISGYIGPAPVSLAAYTAMIAWQLSRVEPVSPEHVSSVISDLVLPAQATELAGLAVSSGRSLFLHGPPGNGKTSLGRAIHNALRGDLWIPHCIGIDSNIIRVFDPQCHAPVDRQGEADWPTDRRWVRVRRPHIVVGGEMTLDSFDLTYSPALRYYEAPLHVKANGGTYLIDDFGRQRVNPHELLNRWIVPLEHQIDYLTLHTGQKIQVPFRVMLIIATNLDIASITDPAFLRRMGYRLHVGTPTPELYAEIFERYAARRGAAVPPGLVGRLLERYRAAGRELRSCEPRNLVERAADICRYRGLPLALSDEVLDLAWVGYFGEAADGV